MTNETIATKDSQPERVDVWSREVDELVEEYFNRLFAKFHTLEGDLYQSPSFRSIEKVLNRAKARIKRLALRTVNIFLRKKRMSGIKEVIHKKISKIQLWEVVHASAFMILSAETFILFSKGKIYSGIAVALYNLISRPSLIMLNRSLKLRLNKRLEHNSKSL